MNLNDMKVLLFLRLDFSSLRERERERESGGKFSRVVSHARETG